MYPRDGEDRGAMKASPKSADCFETLAESREVARRAFREGG